MLVEGGKGSNVRSRNEDKGHVSEENPITFLIPILNIIGDFFRESIWKERKERQLPSL